MNDRLRAMLPVLLDLLLPIGGYFLLHNVFGLSNFWALAIAGVATAINASINTARRGKLDALGLLVVIEVALSVGLLFVTNDPRVLLLKPAFYVAVGGCYAVGTCFAGRPLGYEPGKPFVTRGNPDLVAAYERAWERSARFRGALRSVTVAWGLAFLLDAVARVIVVFSFPPEQVASSLVLSQLPLVLLFIAAIVVTRLRMRAVRPIMHAQLLTPVPG